jgi:hypothetical protein
LSNSDEGARDVAELRGVAGISGGSWMLVAETIHVTFRMIRQQEATNATNGTSETTKCMLSLNIA